MTIALVKISCINDRLIPLGLAYLQAYLKSQFLFMIQDVRTKSILFIGRAMNPPPTEPPKGASPSKSFSKRDVKANIIDLSNQQRSKRQRFFNEMKDAFQKRKTEK